MGAPPARAGRGVVSSPNLLKQRTVLSYARRFGLRTLIETGTFFGDMIRATKRYFARVISVELDEALHERAVREFARDPHITIFHGDNGCVLPELLRTVTEPCLFWLDSHYSGGITAKAEVETPIRQERETIFSHARPDHVILIDDARCFDGTHNYPMQDGLREFVTVQRPTWEFSVEDDIIRMHP